MKKKQILGHTYCNKHKIKHSTFNIIFTYPTNFLTFYDYSTTAPEGIDISGKKFISIWNAFKNDQFIGKLISNQNCHPSPFFFEPVTTNDKKLSAKITKQ